MFCILGFIVFGILGIFSATHRELAKEAGQCVLRRITFRPCNVTFKERMKGLIVGRLLNRSVTLAKIFNKYLELFSWILVVLTILSTVWVVRDIYNYYAYGSCNGLNASGFCVFDPSNKNNQTSSDSVICRAKPPKETDLTSTPLNLSQYPEQGQGNKNKVVFIGSYGCDYTREAYPIIKELAAKKSVDFVFIDFPINSAIEYITPYAYCAYEQDKDKFWQLNDLLFASEKSVLENKEYVENLIKNLGFNLDQIKACVNNQDTQNKTLDQYEEIKQTGIYGTPIVFINNKAFVGPKPERVYNHALNK